MNSETTTPSAPLHAIVTPLQWTGNHHQLQRADALNYRFYVGPDPDNRGGFRYASWDRMLTAHYWEYCETEQQAKDACNREWQEILSEFLSV